MRASSSCTCLADAGRPDCCPNAISAATTRVNLKYDGWTIHRYESSREGNTCSSSRPGGDRESTIGKEGRVRSCPCNPPLVWSCHEARDVPFGATGSRSRLGFSSARSAPTRRSGGRWQGSSLSSPGSCRSGKDTALSVCSRLTRFDSWLRPSLSSRDHCRRDVSKGPKDSSALRHRRPLIDDASTMSFSRHPKMTPAASRF